MEFSTPRLNFRLMTVQDAEDIHEVRNKHEVMKWSMKKTPDKDVQETRTWAENTAIPPHAVFSVRERDPQSNENPERVIGTIGMRFMDSPPSLFKDTYVVTSTPFTSPSPDTSTSSSGSLPTAATSEKEGKEAHPQRWELGYQFHPDFWGKGYGTEALRGLLAAWEGMWPALRERQALVEGEGHEDDEGMEILYAVTDKRNGPSQRVLVKAGFEVVGGFVDPIGTECVDYVYRFSPSSSSS